MTDPNPITPPPELVQQWMDVWYRAKVKHVGICSFVATQAARWGADQELEACLEWLNFYAAGAEATDLRAARRPVQPSLKEQALEALDKILSQVYSPDAVKGLEPQSATIRAALDQLPEAPAVTPAADDPAPTADGGVPLWELMQKALYNSTTNRGGHAAEMRAVADSLERQQIDNYAVVLPDVREVLGWLRAEADRTENNN